MNKILDNIYEEILNMRSSGINPTHVLVSGKTYINLYCNHDKPDPFDREKCEIFGVKVDVVLGQDQPCRVVYCPSAATKNG